MRRRQTAANLPSFVTNPPLYRFLVQGYGAPMPFYRIFPTRDGHVCGPPVDRNLPDDTAALLAAMAVTTAELGAEAWEYQRLVVILPPMPRRPTT